MASNMQRMSSYKSQIEKYGTPISKEEYAELSTYANKYHITLSGLSEILIGDLSLSMK